MTLDQEIGAERKKKRIDAFFTKSYQTGVDRLIKKFFLTYDNFATKS